MQSEASCMELALEGERLCKAGNCREGVRYLEAAVEVGTDDLKTLSAIYSQLGNAYFFLEDYGKALTYHKHDLTLATSIGDRLGEAKASGNIGNTLKVLGKFDEAICCCQRHLDISRELSEKVGEGRALYNLGNVYHAKGKHAGRSGHQDPGDFPQEVTDCLKQAIQFYEANLAIVRELGDRAAQGRACGNLGNTHYLLGNFETAIQFHTERLAIAKEFGDKAAERRAYSNLGNACVFMVQFEVAAKYYKKALHIARQLGELAMEAQACYSLGNTYTLLREYEKAVEYHGRHMEIAQELNDRVGEGRACWSLGNAHTSLGNHEKALHYATLHLQISREVGDRTGEVTAKMNLQDLQSLFGISTSDISDVSTTVQTPLQETKGARPRRRRSMENLELVAMTPEKKAEISQVPKRKIRPGSKIKLKNGGESKDKQSLKHSKEPVSSAKNSAPAPSKAKTQTSARKGGEPTQMLDDADNFFEALSRFQSNRMDEQRCSFGRLQKKLADEEGNGLPEKEELLDEIAKLQGSRLNEQRASSAQRLPGLPGLRANEDVVGKLLAKGDRAEPDDDFFEMIIRCQGARIEDQRSTLPIQVPAPTVPDEDFFSLIQRIQSKRIEEQRTIPPWEKGSGTSCVCFYDYDTSHAEGTACCVYIRPVQESHL
ncbi:G-protein-signaling modulator 2-like isoform X1 [Lytechinus variegatus]|uniref:G-protein-signaling modulator 2-like isoform X1 n=1 Tax=Lytechinus variegatus TaxID=7654 RepID=UPI001BB2CBDD|nr:G-protein-signaling modulator 2-like isoform X1 [Lytechinus variegatus]